MQAECHFSYTLKCALLSSQQIQFADHDQSEQITQLACWASQSHMSHSRPGPKTGSNNFRQVREQLLTTGTVFICN